MSYELIILVFAPVVLAVFSVVGREDQALKTGAVASLIPVGLTIHLLAGFKTGAGLQQYFSAEWIKPLGIHFALGVDSLSVFLVALAVLGWSIAMFASIRMPIDRPRIYVLMMGLAQTATLGAFLAQDLILFVLFFDLLLIPLYLLIGLWGQGDRRAATTKFIIYTLFGSLLMFTASIGLGLAAAHGGHVNFLFTNLIHSHVSNTAQTWIFVGFALALLIKMPAFPLHGWMPDTYKATPLPVLVVLSAVVAKIGTYGFLRVVLPFLPHASSQFQTLMLVISLVSIIYGSVVAFSADNVRLIVGYSSIAQLGFIGLGIWSLSSRGVEGATFQMVNHGLVVIALFLIIGFLNSRSGSDSLAGMGGIARRAPVIAALFLIVALATLAMPGSANFVGELYILFGAFGSSFTYGVIAAGGVVLAAVYMVRFYERSMHNRDGEHVESREASSFDLAVLTPAVVVILALAVYPQWVVKKIEPATRVALARVSAVTAIEQFAPNGKAKATVKEKGGGGSSATIESQGAE